MGVATKGLGVVKRGGQKEMAWGERAAVKCIWQTSEYRGSSIAKNITSV